MVWSRDLFTCRVPRRLLSNSSSPLYTLKQLKETVHRRPLYLVLLRRFKRCWKNNPAVFVFIEKAEAHCVLSKFSGLWTRIVIEPENKVCLLLIFPQSQRKSDILLAWSRMTVMQWKYIFFSSKHCRHL